MGGVRMIGDWHVRTCIVVLQRKRSSLELILSVPKHLTAVQNSRHGGGCFRVERRELYLNEGNRLLRDQESEVQQEQVQPSSFFRLM